MSIFKSKLKYTASLIPPVRRLFAERDALRLQNEALQKNVQQLQG